MKPSAAFLAVAVVALGACPRDTEPTPSPAPAPQPAAQAEAKAQPAPAPDKPKKKTKAEREAERRTYAFQFAKEEKVLAGVQKLVDGHPESPMNWGRLAGAYMGRARLTGSYDDYAKAQEAVDKGFTVMKNFGPFMTRARLNYTLHRLDRIDPDLAIEKKKIGRKKANLAADLVFEANLAFQRGQYDDAEKLYEKSLELGRYYNNLSGYAIFQWKTGHFDEAEALLREALEGYKAKPTMPIAWIHLQLGLMDLDRGRWDDALAHYREADSWIRGYWLVDEHIAEVLTLQGKTDESKKLYLDIIARTDNPEFMDAMAGILRDEGKSDEAQTYIDQANERFEAQLARFPEAAYGHALGHFIEFGTDPAKTLDMAEKNHTLRPNGEAKTLLAEAALAAGKLARAKKVIGQALASRYENADVHTVAARVYLAAGDRKRAAAQVELAKAINPHAEVPDLEPGKAPGAEQPEPAEDPPPTPADND